MVKGFAHTKRLWTFSPTGPSGPSWSSSHDVRVLSSAFIYLSPSHAIFSRPFMGPVITWSVQGLSLVSPPHPRPPGPLPPFFFHFFIIFYFKLIMLPLQICIGSTIRIGWESWCLPYVGLFFSDFYLFRVQRWLHQFVYITTNCSCCPLNCFSVQANCPICRSPNTMPFCSTSTRPSAATTSMSGSQQAGAWPGLPAARPCPTPLSLGSWPPLWTTCPWGSAAPPGAAEMSSVSFQMQYSGSSGELCWGWESPCSHGVSSPLGQIGSNWVKLVKIA